MTANHTVAAAQDSSRILDEAAVIVLDQLAEAGQATREALFARSQPGFLGRMINVAARRAGYEGHDEQEVDRRGRRQLFDEALETLLRLRIVVVWDEQTDTLAVHPMHREPIYAGGVPYEPGTNYWRNQRNNALTGLRQQLMMLREGTELHAVGDVYRQQIRRGLLEGEARHEAIVELMKLANLLFDPHVLARMLGVTDDEVLVAWHALHAMPAVATPPEPKRRKRSTVKPMSDPDVEVSPVITEPQEASSPIVRTSNLGTSTFPRQHGRPPVTLDQIASFVRLRGAVPRGKLMTALHVAPETMDAVLVEYRQRFPGTVITEIMGNRKPGTIIYAPGKQP